MATNIRLKAFFEGLVNDDDPDLLNQSELAKATGISRAVVGAIVRGSRGTYRPEEINEIAKYTEVRVERILKEAGFNVAITPVLAVDPKLEKLWPDLSPAARKLILELAQTAAKTTRQLRGSAQ